MGQFRDDDEARDYLKKAVDGWQANPKIFDEQPEAQPQTRTIEAFGDPAPEQEPEAAPAPIKRTLTIPRDAAHWGPVTPPPPAAESKPDELAELQAFARRRRQGSLLGEAANLMTANYGLAPGKEIKTNQFWEKYGQEGDQAVADLKARRGEAERLEKKAKADAEERGMADGASPESISLAEQALALHPSLAKFITVGQTPGKQTKQILPFLPALIKREPAAPKPVDPRDGELKDLQIERLRKSLESKPVDPLDADKKQAEIDRIKATTAKLSRPAAVKADTSASKAAAATSRAITDLRKEVNHLPEVKAFKDVEVAFDKVQSAAANPSPAGDLSLIYAYNKMLDPGSAVKEGEFKNAALAGSFGDKIQAQVAKVASGEMLTPDQRKDFVAQSKHLFEAQAKQADSAVERYRKLAQKAGGDADDVAVGRKKASGEGYDLEPLVQPKPKQVKVSNGKETLWIDAEDLADAAGDGFKEVR